LACGVALQWRRALAPWWRARRGWAGNTGVKC
jgi:hypothetical protein